MTRAILTFLCILLGTLPVSAGVTYTAVQSGNFSAASTWRVSATDSANLNVDNMTSFCAGGLAGGGGTTWDGANVTIANGEVIEGIVVFLRHLNNIGTYTVRLSDNGTTGTIVATATINLADLPVTTSHPVMIYMKFVTPYTSTGLTTMRFGHGMNGGGSANGYSNCGTNYWHVFVTPTQGVPVANANLMVAGVGTTPFTLTMDNTATTDFGWMNLGPAGTVEWSTAAATNLYLKLSGSLHLRWGTWRMGTVAAPIPASSTAVLEFDSTSNGEFGVYFYEGEFTMVGSPRTAGKNVVWTTLTANEAVASTAIDIAADTGWKSGDEVAFAPTTRTWNQFEHKSLAADAGASSLALTAGLTYAHDGTAPSQGEVALLTRNVIMRSANTFYTFFHGGGPAQGSIAPSFITLRWVLFKYVGANIDQKYGLDIRNYTPGSTFSMQYCAMWLGAAHGLTMVDNATDGAAVINDNVFYNNSTQCGSCAPIYLGMQNTYGTYEVRRNVSIGSAAYGILDNGSKATLVGNRISGSQYTGIRFAGTSDQNNPFWRTFEGNTSHSNGNDGITIDVSRIRLQGSASAWNEVWRNNSMGFNLAQAHQSTGATYIKSWGNTSASFQFGGGHYGDYSDLVGNGETGWTTSYGVWLRDGNAFSTSQIKNVTLGVASGTLLTHATCDVISSSGPVIWPGFVLSNFLMASATEICPLANNGNLPGWLFFERADNNPTRNFATSESGIVEQDSAIYDTAPASIKLSPSVDPSLSGVITTHLNGFVPGFRALVKSGIAPTISVRVRRNAAYSNPTPPQLFVVANAALGILHDTLIGTFAGSADTWNTVTGTVPTPTADGVLEFYVVAYGTTGSIWVDTVTFGNLNTVDTTKIQTWHQGVAVVQAQGGVGNSGDIALRFRETNALWPSVSQGLPPHAAPTGMEFSANILKISQPVPILKNGTLGAVTFRVIGVTTPQTIRVGYRYPHATTVARPALTNDQYVDITPTANTTFTVTPTSDGTVGGTKRIVNAGDVVWVTFEWVGAAGTVSIQRTAGAFAYTHDFMRFAYLYVDANWYIDTAAQMIVGLQYTDNSWVKDIGEDRASVVTVEEVLLNASATPDEVGMKFVAPYDMKVNGVSFRLYGGGANILVALYDAADVVIGSHSIPARFTYGTTQSYPAIFDQGEVTLLKGQTYRFTIRPQSGGEQFYYYGYTATALDAEDGGATTIKTERTNQTGAWTDTPNARLHMQLIVTGVGESGTGGSGSMVSLGPYFVPTPPVGLNAMAPASTNVQTIDAVNEATSVTFRVPKSGVLDRVEFRIAAVSNQPDNGIRVSFQDHAAGVPDGTADQFRVIPTGITANSWLVPPGAMTSDGTDSGTKRTVTAGDYLTVLIENASFVAGDSFQITAMVTQNTSNQQLAKAQTFAQIRSTTNVWSAVEHPLPLVLRYADGSYEALAPIWYPILTLNTATFNNATTPGDERGMRFTVPAQTRLRGMWFRGDAKQAMDVVLYDATNTVVATSTLATFQDQNNGENYLVPFPSVTLQPSVAYRLTLKPTSVSNVSLYDYDVANNALLAAVEGGATWYYTSRTDAGAWTDTDTKRPWMGLWVDGINTTTGSGTPAEVSHPFP